MKSSVSDAIQWVYVNSIKNKIQSIKTVGSQAGLGKYMHHACMYVWMIILNGSGLNESDNDTKNSKPLADASELFLQQEKMGPYV